MTSIGEHARSLLPSLLPSDSQTRVDAALHLGARCPCPAWHNARVKTQNMSKHLKTCQNNGTKGHKAPRQALAQTAAIGQRPHSGFQVEWSKTESKSAPTLLGTLSPKCSRKSQITNLTTAQRCAKVMQQQKCRSSLR